ncbi:MAG TPA: cytidylate kinase-like family protein [Actinomycetota bacterium]|nr:cytidylate kinase-like family protein [Actinomycetota bacterium]
MKPATGLERYLEFVRYESRLLRESLSNPPRARRPVITISRQAGCGAHVVAEELVARLQARTEPGSSPWTVFDRNLVDKVLTDHELPDRLAEFMPEDRVSEIADTLDELFGLHPSTRTLVRQTAETILHLAELGNVVLIGRGANVVTSEVDRAFHVRLVGSVQRRVEYVQEHLHLSPDAAAKHVREEDLGRKRYLKKYYAKDIDDPLLYHLVINTDRVSHVEAARMIAEASSAHPDASGPAAVGPSRMIEPSLD